MHLSYKQSLLGFQEIPKKFSLKTLRLKILELFFFKTAKLRKKEIFVTMFNRDSLDITESSQSLRLALSAAVFISAGREDDGVILSLTYDCDRF